MAPIHEGLERREFARPGDVSLRPVPGGIDVAHYTVRCVDTSGNVIHEASLRSAADREVVVSAPSLEGYRLVGDHEKTIMVTSDSGRNIAVFIYESLNPTVPVDPNEPVVTEEPVDPPPTEPPQTEPPPTEPPPTEPPPAEPPQTQEPPDTTLDQAPE